MGVNFLSQNLYISSTRELTDETNRRVSLDSKPPRKEKTSPSYCIKDMKAIFESKSHQ